MQQRKTGAMDSTSAALTLERIGDLVLEVQGTGQQVAQESTSIKDFVRGKIEEGT